MPAGSKDDHIPQGAQVRVYVVGVHSYVTGDGGEDKVKAMPQYLQLDIWIRDKHVYRLTDVAVSKFYISKVYGGGFCLWTLWLDMADGFALDTPAGPLILRRTSWCWKTS